MTLVCINHFGNFEPGDEIEVPDGAVYDAAFFREKDADVPAEEPAPEAPAEVTEEEHE